VLDATTGALISSAQDSPSALLDTFTVTKPQVNLTVDLSAPASVVQGGELNYIFNVSNLSPYPLNGVQAVFTLPAGRRLHWRPRRLDDVAGAECRRRDYRQAGGWREPHDYDSHRRRRKSSGRNAVAGVRAGAVGDGAAGDREPAKHVCDPLQRPVDQAGRETPGPARQSSANAGQSPGQAERQATPKSSQREAFSSSRT